MPSNPLNGATVPNNRTIGFKISTSYVLARLSQDKYFLHKILLVSYWLT